MPLPRLLTGPGRVGLAALGVAAAFALGGCQSLERQLQTTDSLFGVITPYKVEVVQGNIITREQAAQARIGMSRAQVRDALGSPLLADLFHANRWDYVFTIRRQGAEPQLRRVIVLFENDKMASMDTGGELPWERDFVAAIDTFKPSRAAPDLQLTEEQIKALPTPPKQAPPPAAAEPSGPARDYPPLEPS
jgi:outer membrane protein assembly factor BamE